MKASTHKKTTEQSQSNTLPALSIIFGVVSLVGPGLLLGIPAIVMAGIALKKNLPNKGLSIAGLVTGIISTVLSLLFLIIVGIVIAWAINNPHEFQEEFYYPEYQDTPAYQGART